MAPDDLVADLDDDTALREHQPRQAVDRPGDAAFFRAFDQVDAVCPKR